MKTSSRIDKAAQQRPAGAARTLTNGKTAARLGARTASLGLLLTAVLAGCGGGGDAQDAADASDEAQLLAQFESEQSADSDERRGSADAQLRAYLARAGLTGWVEASLPVRLKRPVDPKLATLGRDLFFDTAGGLHDDNNCAGCHAPDAAFGDTQSIAIGINSNGIVGPDRKGPRNQRRTPSVVNSAFFPALMWNGRFFAPGGDPFSNAQGYTFTPPEGSTYFGPNDPAWKHLLVAQAHIPPTELTEVAGFTGTAGTISPRFDAFDDGLGQALPPPDATGFRNEPIREAVLERLNGTDAYVKRFAEHFPAVKAGGPITFPMFGQAIAEFEFSLTRANAPVDRFMRGDRGALSNAQKRGAVLFFGKARCGACHAVGGSTNEMFSDFRMHNIGVPQIAPAFGPRTGNVLFDGPGEDEDFGLEQVTGNPADRYKFRTSPLRNVALQPAFMHNGAYTRLEDAIRHHLDPRQANRAYDARKAGVDADLFRRGPSEPVLQRLDPLLATPIRLSEREFDDLVRFVGQGLLDPRAQAEHLCKLVPSSVPSGRPLLRFQGCRKDD